MSVIIGYVKYFDENGVGILLPFGFRNVRDDKVEDKVRELVAKYSGTFHSMYKAKTDDEVNKVAMVITLEGIYTEPLYMAQRVYQVTKLQNL